MNGWDLATQAVNLVSKLPIERLFRRNHLKDLEQFEQTLKQKSLLTSGKTKTPAPGENPPRIENLSASAGDLTDPTRAPESQKEGLLAATVPQILPEENPREDIATGCLPCALGHFSLSSGLLKEAVRFKGEGITSNEILDRIAIALEEQNSLEREDLSPEKIQGLPGWERPIAEEALTQSRQLRHRLESIQSIDELEQVAVDTKRYYIKLNRQWYRGRFRNLGTGKAEAIAQRVGEG